MAASFAGAKSLEGRRRRRLATGADEPAPSRKGAAAPAKPRRRAKKGTELRATRFPLKRLISRHRWKIWAAGLLLVLPILGLQAAAQHPEELALRAGPAIAALLDPADARLARAYSGILLLVSSQLCVMIYWVRSKSPADFGGRFGVWLFGAAACFLFATCVSTDAHLVFAQTAVHFKMVHLPQLGQQMTETLCWLVPTGIFGAALTKSILSDMRKSPSSFLSLSLAALSWGGGVFLRFDNQWSVRVPDRELVASSLVMLGHVWLTLSMLLHARFVLFESAAPPVEKVETPAGSSIGGLFRKLFGRRDEAADAKKGSAKRGTKSGAKPAKKPAKTGKDAAEETEKSEEEDEEDLERLTAPTPAKPASESKPAVKPAAASSTSASSQSKTSPTPQKTDSRPQAGGKPTFTMPSSSSHHDEEDEDEEDDEEGYSGGPDKSALKGLSKRERRKVQKQWREEQRTGRAA